jgi:hypothetical protein
MVLLAVALVIPQLAWADHASDHPYSQFDDPSINSPSVAYDALVEKYKAGELVFHAPGRRDDRSFSTSPSEAYAGLVEKYKSGELVFHAPGRRDDRSFSTSLSEADSADSDRWVAQGKYYLEKSERAAAADSARWAALGASYTSGNAGFLAENPEIMVSRRYAASDQTDAAFLAANPEIMTFRRFVGQQDCSDLGLQC